MNITNEKAFEESIEQSLLEYGGYVKGDPAAFDIFTKLYDSLLSAIWRRER